MKPVKNILIASVIMMGTISAASTAFGQDTVITEEQLLERYKEKKANRKAVAYDRRDQGIDRYHAAMDEARARMQDEKDRSQTRYMNERDDRAAKWLADCVGAGRADCDRALTETRERRDATVARVQNRRDGTHDRLRDRHDATRVKSKSRHKDVRKSNVKRHKATKHRIKVRKDGK